MKEVIFHLVSNACPPPASIDTTVRRGGLVLLEGALGAQTGRLAGALAQIVEAGAADVAVAVGWAGIPGLDAEGEVG